MFSLIKIEWLKIKKYPAFWWMLGIVALTYPGVNTMFYYIYLDIANGKDMARNVAKMLLGNPFAFPETWHSVAYFSSFFVLDRLHLATFSIPHNLKRTSGIQDQTIGS